MKIIIADDEEFVRFELRELLLEIRSGLEITEVVNGTELQEQFQVQEFDAAFIDIRMPGLSGLEAIEKIGLKKGSTEWIILSGYADFEYAKNAITLGVTEYLLKPVTRVELEEVLVKIDKNLAKKAGKLIFDNSIEGHDGLIHLVRSAERIIRERYCEQIGVSQIAEELGVTPNYLSSLFKKFTHTTFTSYLTDLRMARALELLKEPGISVKKTSSSIGYTSIRHFARLFRERYDLSPSEFMEKCRN